MIFILITTTIISAFRGWKWWALCPFAFALFFGLFFMILMPNDQGMALDVLCTLAAIVASTVMCIHGREVE